jgi:hypothetical protein
LWQIFRKWTTTSSWVMWDLETWSHFRGQENPREPIGSIHWDGACLSQKTGIFWAICRFHI